jgi:hypothetical protein
MKSNVCLNWAKVSFRVGFNLRVRNRQAKAIPPVGRLMSVISLTELVLIAYKRPIACRCQLSRVNAIEPAYQETRSVRRPPMMGPKTLAIPQIPPMKPCQYPLVSSGVISADD